MSEDPFEVALNGYYQASQELADAVTAEAEAWIRFKEGIKGCTDGQADRMATAETHAAVIVKEALLEIAQHRLEQACRRDALNDLTQGPGGGLLN